MGNISDHVAANTAGAESSVWLPTARGIIMLEHRQL